MLCAGLGLLLNVSLLQLHITVISTVMSGTPSKKRKIESTLQNSCVCYCNTYCICSGTWESVVKDLPPEAVEGIDNLPVLLSRKGPLSGFSSMDEDVQKFFLCSVLGEESPLIPLLMEGAKVS